MRSWASDSDERASATLRVLTDAKDALVNKMKALGGAAPAVSSRLKYVDFREPVMVACYPGDARGKYLRHCDTGRGAALTAILYLNEGWNSEDAGELRLYEEGFHNTQVKADIAPLANRLLLFWATDECPHEVLATRRDRFAMTTWYRDGGCFRNRAASENALPRCHLTPLALSTE